MLKCGMFEMNITPPIGLDMPGYYMHRYATGIKDELFAKSMVLEDGKNIVAFVALDMIGVEREDVLNIREKVFKQTGIPEENIMVSATHTHTGPPVVRNLFADKKDEKYMEYVTKKAADAAIVAFNKRIPVQVGCGTGIEKDIAFNRRYKMKDGKVVSNPGIGNPLVEEAAGPIDPDVAVMRIDDLEGHPVGVVTNYACHLDTVGGMEYSADFPGELSAVVKKVLGQGVVSLFFTGACGNINHVDVSGNMKINPGHHKKMGRILAGEVLKIREKIRLEEELKVEAAQSVFEIKARQPSKESVEEAEKILGLPSSSENEKRIATGILKAHRNAVESVEAEVQVIKIGELQVSGLPAEMFVEFGLDIKSRSSFRYNMINELANGCNGYVATREAFGQGGYETRLNRYNRLLPEAGYIMVDKIIELQKREVV